MDLTDSITPKSDQLNADDLIAGPVTVTIKAVARGTAEQPVNVNLTEYPGRPYKPSKSMRRVMILAWGPEASTYTGRRLTLYRNPDIKFGGEKVGGIEISHLSHIDKEQTFQLTATRGKKRGHTIRPLADARDWGAELELAGDNIDAVVALGKAAKAANVTPAIIAPITARYNELKPA